MADDNGGGLPEGRAPNIAEAIVLALIANDTEAQLLTNAEFARPL